MQMANFMGEIEDLLKNKEQEGEDSITGPVTDSITDPVADTVALKASEEQLAPANTLQAVSATEAAAGVPEHAEGSSVSGDHTPDQAQDPSPSGEIAGTATAQADTGCLCRQHDTMAAYLSPVNLQACTRWRLALVPPSAAGTVRKEATEWSPPPPLSDTDD